MPWPKRGAFLLLMIKGLPKLRLLESVKSFTISTLVAYKCCFVPVEYVYNGPTKQKILIPICNSPSLPLASIVNFDPSYIDVNITIFKTRLLERIFHTLIYRGVQKTREPEKLDRTQLNPYDYELI